MIFLQRFKHYIAQNKYKNKNRNKIEYNSFCYGYLILRLEMIVWFAKMYNSRFIQEMCCNIDKQYINELTFYTVEKYINGKRKKSQYINIKHDYKYTSSETIITIEIDHIPYIKQTSNMNYCHIAISLHNSDIMMIGNFKIDPPHSGPVQAVFSSF